MRRQHAQPDSRPSCDRGRNALGARAVASAPGVAAHTEATAPEATSVASAPVRLAHGKTAHDEAAHDQTAHDAAPHHAAPHDEPDHDVAAHCEAARATASSTCATVDDMGARGEVLGGLDELAPCSDSVSLAGWFLRAEARRWDCWELEFDLEHAAGIVRAADQSPDAGTVLRFDLPQALAQDCAAPRAAVPAASGPAATPAWWLVCLGCLLLAFGGALCLLGVRSARDELTTLGSPAAVAGGLMLVLGMALQYRRLRDVPTATHGDVPPPHSANWLSAPPPQHAPQSPHHATGPDWSPAVRQVAYLPLAVRGGSDDLA